MSKWKAHLILSEVEGSGPNLSVGQFFHTLFRRSDEAGDRLETIMLQTPLIRRAPTGDRRLRYRESRWRPADACPLRDEQNRRVRLASDFRIGRIGRIIHHRDAVIGLAAAAAARRDRRAALIRAARRSRKPRCCVRPPLL